MNEYTKTQNANESQVRGAGDSHFTLGPALNKVFMFSRDVSLVSISPDGIALPDIYEVGESTMHSGWPHLGERDAYAGLKAISWLLKP